MCGSLLVVIHFDPPVDPESWLMHRQVMRASRWRGGGALNVTDAQRTDAGRGALSVM